MYCPSRKEFVKKAKSGNLIPVYGELLSDLETPVSAFSKIDRGGFSYLLESVEGGEKVARYSFLGSRPSVLFQSRGSTITVTRPDGKSVYECRKDPLDEIKRFMSEYKFVESEGLPRFCGGLVGFMGYDMVRFFERLPDKNPDDLRVPDCMFMLTDTIVIFDHVNQRMKIVSNAHVRQGKGRSRAFHAERAYDEAVSKIENLKRMLSAPGKKVARSEKARGTCSVSSNFTKIQFEDCVLKAKKYIRAGDIVQAVLSQRFETGFRPSGFDLYRALRSVNPSPYMYCLKLGDFQLIGSSPEVLVRCENNRVEVRPIAGTRRRGRDESEDNALMKELLADGKERAEHVMLVDLGRNDLGRVCRYGTVKVPEFMTVEKYSHVMHIVSDVVGDLSPGKDAFDVIRAAFPAGTVSGAPKVRAMEIIDELENLRRGPYAGAVGYFSFSGNLDTCITIRTVLLKGGKAYVQAGAGIVADSRPEREYQETVNKAKGMFKAIELANDLHRGMRA